MTNALDPIFSAEIERIREVFAQYRHGPRVLVHSHELEERTRDASRAAAVVGMPFVATCAEFGRAATESFPGDRLAAIAVGRAMTRWAAQVYHGGAVADVAVS